MALKIILTTLIGLTLPIIAHLYGFSIYVLTLKTSWQYIPVPELYLGIGILSGLAYSILVVRMLLAWWK